MIEQLKKIVDSVINSFINYYNRVSVDDSDINISSIIYGNEYILTPQYNMHCNVSIVQKKWIDIEFFEESSSKVNIQIIKQNKKTIYSLNTFTVPTLHIVIDIEDWFAGVYSIQINSELEYLKADFILENDYVLDRQEVNTIVSYQNCILLANSYLN